VRTYEELKAAIIAAYKAISNEIGDEAIAAGLTSDDLIPDIDPRTGPDLHRVVVERCGFSPAEAALLGADLKAVSDPLLFAVAVILLGHEVDRGQQLFVACQAILLDEEATNDPRKLRRMLIAAVDAAADL
jgi:hypothetical protein